MLRLPQDDVPFDGPAFDARKEGSALHRALELALRKKHMGRDLVFREAAKAAHRALRDCVREKQPGLDGLAKALAARLSV